MNSREQNIKNGATAFAIILAIIIISIICIGAYSFISLFTPDSENNNVDEEVHKIYENSFPEKIIIDNAAGKLTIKSGDCLEVSAQNVLNNFSCDYDNGILTLKNENKKGVNFSASNSFITITIPEGVTLSSFQLNTGAGSADIDNLSTDSITLEAGAGNIELTNSSLKDIYLVCGVGNLSIKDSTLSGKSTIECGVGKFNVDNSELIGDCTIECGVGGFTLNLNGDINDYEISLSEGIGKMKLNGTSYTELNKMNKGATNVLNIKGGIGAVTINIK